MPKVQQFTIALDCASFEKSSFISGALVAKFGISGHDSTQLVSVSVEAFECPTDNLLISIATDTP